MTLGSAGRTACATSAGVLLQCLASTSVQWTLMNRRTGAALFVCVAALFLIANRGAYRGYFQDDELDNISWTPQVPAKTFVEALVTPRYLKGNFRPVGHFYFYVMSRAFGLDFPKYIVPLHVLHLLNVWLIWLIARRLGAGPFAAGCGALFFAFNMVVFDVLWKPMYVFDLLCGTCCLSSLLFYLRRWYIASFVMFWLAYKSKELAVMLPAVLVCYEYWMGKRNWKALAPFCAAAAIFGVQGLVGNPNKNNDYAFHFGVRSLAKTAFYYADDILQFPLAGLALPIVPLFTRNRLVWLGIAATGLFLCPLFLLRDRTYDAYLYVPLIGLALACAGAAGTQYRKLAILFFALWIPWNEFELRLHRRRALAVANENRAYVQALQQATAAYPATRTFVYDGAPFSMRQWGVRGALELLYHTREIRLSNVEDKDVQRMLAADRVVILSWDSPRQKLAVAAREPGTPDTAYIAMTHGTPLWQLADGWYGLESFFRWTQPRATARLMRPEGARAFQLEVNIGPELLRDVGHLDAEVRIEARSIGKASFTAKGRQSTRWELAPGQAGEVTVELVAHAYHPPAPDARVLGLPVVGFGFVGEREH